MQSKEICRISREISRLQKRDHQGVTYVTFQLDCFLNNASCLFQMRCTSQKFPGDSILEQNLWPISTLDKPSESSRYYWFMTSGTDTENREGISVQVLLGVHVFVCLVIKTLLLLIVLTFIHTSQFLVSLKPKSDTRYFYFVPFINTYYATLINAYFTLTHYFTNAHSNRVLFFFVLTFFIIFIPFFVFFISIP